MANEWLQQNREALNRLKDNAYRGSMLDAHNSGPIRQAISERLAMSGPVLHWDFQTDSGRHLGAIVNNIPGVLANFLLFDSHDKPEADSIVQISYKPFSKMDIGEGDNKVSYERGQLYVGDIFDAAEFIAMTCGAMEQGRLASEVITAARTTHARFGPYYSQAPDAVRTFFEQYQKALVQGGN